MRFMRGRASTDVRHSAILLLSVLCPLDMKLQLSLYHDMTIELNEA